MFRMLEDVVQSYSWPVKIEIPVDGGRYRDADFQAVFQMLGQDEIDDIIRRIQDEDAQDEDLANRLLIGWTGVVGKDGEALAFSDENRSALLNVPYVRRAVLRAYLASMGGRKARQKN